MLGLLFQYFHDFVEHSFGDRAWERARERAAVPERSFVLARGYPDRYLGELLAGLRQELGEEAPPAQDLLFEYGRHVCRCFERDFDFYFRRFASARDMIAGIEPVIHVELRRNRPSAQPPILHAFPMPHGCLRVVYDSPRRLCAFLRGIAIQVGESFGETVTIEEPRCMNRGDAVCELFLSFARSESPRSGASPP